MKKSYIAITYLCITLISCNIDLKFEKDDKDWLKPYKKGDILIFRSDRNIDSITISEVGYENIKRDLIESNYNSIHGFINYRNNFSNEQENLITISKLYPKHPTRAVINFKGDFGSIQDINSYPSSENMFKGKKRKGFMFRPLKHDKPSFQWDFEYGLSNPNLAYFFWDKEFGIIEYKTIKGEIFLLDKFIRSDENILKGIK